MRNPIIENKLGLSHRNYEYKENKNINLIDNKNSYIKAIDYEVFHVIFN